MELLYIIGFLFCCWAITNNRDLPTPKQKPKNTPKELNKLFANLSTVDMELDPPPNYNPETPLMFLSAEVKATHLKSMDWTALKFKRLVMASYKCEVPGCKQKYHLQLHHVTYARLTQENIEDLRIVCKYHHTLLHKQLGLDRTTYYGLEKIVE